MDYRKIFDLSVPPEEFDKWRSCYCDECFADMIAHSGLGPGKSALEIGPGTGQATPPVVQAGCDYLAIELGENFSAAMQKKFGKYDTVRIVNADFETHDFGGEQFDLVYSAATIQWIPEEIGFPKVYALLKHGGTFAMMLTRTDYRTPNEALYQEIQKVYDAYFHPQTPYTCSLAYSNVDKHGFVDFECRHYYETREYSADDFLSWSLIQSGHLTLKESDRKGLIQGVKAAIDNQGGKITLLDDIVLYLARKP